MKLLNSLKAYLQLMRFHKPIGIWLLLWPTLCALWIANHGRPPTKLIIVFIAGVIVMRAAGCVINDIADRQYDGQVSRTANRPLITGAVSYRGAIICFVLLATIAFILTLFLNWSAIALAIPGIALAIAYPFMKRLIQAPQAVLGVAFSWGIPMAFAATHHNIPGAAWALMLANIFWTIAYDTEYALTDREDDLKIGIQSTAIWFGRFDIAAIIGLQMMTLTLFIVIGELVSLQLTYMIAMAIIGILFVYQQQLIKARTTNGYFKAFKNNQWVGLILFLGVTTSLL